MASPMPGMEPEMKTYTAGLWAMAAVLGVIGAAGVIAAAANLGPMSTVWGRAIFMLFALIMLGLGWLTSRAARWYARAAWLLDHSAPVEVTLVLRRKGWSDSTEWSAEVLRHGTSPERYAVLGPRWKAEGTVDTPLTAQAFVDHDAGVPVAFRTSSGLLWVMPGADRRLRLI